MVKYYVLLPAFTLLISVAPSEPGNLNTASLKRQHKGEVTRFPKPYKKRIEAVVAVCTRLHTDKILEIQSIIAIHSPYAFAKKSRTFFYCTFDEPYFQQTMNSYISGAKIKQGEAVKAEELREGIFNLIKVAHPEFSKEHYISIDELNHFRRLYITSLTSTLPGEGDELQKEVYAAIQNNSLVSQSMEDELQEELTIGQQLADRIAQFGGSWVFIISFFLFIACWIITNLWILAGNAYDPYPFILLNLILSCLAAIQAPIIMMSQNRQEQKDRLRAEHDYKINLKAELEIKLLHEKMDQLIVNQNKKLMEIQQIQADYLEDLIQELKKNK
jgi:uncharacterized membrane protein